MRRAQAASARSGKHFAVGATQRERGASPGTEGEEQRHGVVVPAAHQERDARVEERQPERILRVRKAAG